MANWKAGKVQYTFLETVTAAGLLTLVNESALYQIFTGTLSHTLRLPDATTMFDVGELAAVVINESTGSIAVQNAGGVVLTTVPAGGIVEIYLSDKSTANGVWRLAVAGSTGASGILSQGPGATKISSGVGLFAGGSAGGFSNSIEFINFGSEAATQSWGQLTQARTGLNQGCSSNQTRGLFAGGTTGSNPGVNTIDYIVFAVAGNAVDFGDLTVSRQRPAGCSNSTRALWGGGYTFVDPNVGNIDYVTIATAANAGAFGVLSVTRGQAHGHSSATRALFSGGFITSGTNSNVIDYVAFATTGNAVDFGDLTYTPSSGGCGSNSVRAVVGGGYSYAAGNYVTTMNTFIMATLGNASTFGNLANGIRGDQMSVSCQTRALFGGGDAATSTIERVSFESQGGTAIIGNLTGGNRSAGGGASNCHGGL